MDNLVDRNVIEKVKLRDIFVSLRNILVGEKKVEDEKTIEEKLQEIYKVEKEIGVTDSIEELTKNLEKLETHKKRRTNRNTEKIASVNKPIKQTLKLQNEEEKQEEGKEL